MSENFGLYAKYYNLLYNDKDYSIEVAYVDKQIKKYAPFAQTILEFGSGTGIHGLLLEKEGYDVYGLERSESMVFEAKKNGFNCQVADITNFDIIKKFDVAISLFHVISYLVDNDSLVSTFRNANKSLNDGGIFLFDVWYSPAVYDQKALPRIKKMKNDKIEVTRLAEPFINVNKNLVEVNYTVFIKEKNATTIEELNETHPMRHFSIPEIELLAKFSGFEIIHSEEFLSGNSPSTETWGVCFILKKNEKNIL